jgi:hypothetical protein
MIGTEVGSLTGEGVGVEEKLIAVHPTRVKQIKILMIFHCTGRFVEW